LLPEMRAGKVHRAAQYSCMIRASGATPQAR
jgi:hypothetical protein